MLDRKRVMERFAEKASASDSEDDEPPRSKTTKKERGKSSSSLSSSSPSSFFPINESRHSLDTIKASNVSQSSSLHYTHHDGSSSSSSSSGNRGSSGDYNSEGEIFDLTGSEPWRFFEPPQAEEGEGGEERVPKPQPSRRQLRTRTGRSRQSLSHRALVSSTRQGKRAATIMDFCFENNAYMDICLMMLALVLAIGLTLLVVSDIYKDEIASLLAARQRRSGNVRTSLSFMTISPRATTLDENRGTISYHNNEEDDKTTTTMTISHSYSAPSAFQLSSMTLTLKKKQMILPMSIENNLADITEPHVVAVSKNLNFHHHHYDIPFFFDIAPSNSGDGALLNRITRQCFGFVEASKYGNMFYESEIWAFQQKQELQVKEFSHREGERGQEQTGQGGNAIDNSIRLVNVDTTTINGLRHASTVNLAESGLVDIYISPLLRPSCDLIFTPQHKGRMFTILIHPVARAIRTYMQNYPNNDHKNDPNDIISSFISLIQRTNREVLDNNLVTRLLVNKAHPGVVLTKSDLEYAMEILRRKCLIGLEEYIVESIKRFNIYFGWNKISFETNVCVEKIIQNYFSTANMTTTTTVTDVVFATVKRNSVLWNFIMTENKYDILLYEYGLKLFREQKYFFFS